MMDSLLRIVAWNARSVLQRRNELLFFLRDKNVDVALISETHLQPRHQFKVPGYAVYRTDRPPRGRGNPGGGTMVMVNRRLVHRIHGMAAGGLEATGVFIHAMGYEILVVAGYLAPRAGFDPAPFDLLFDHPSPVIVAGDLNAKHRSWNSMRSNQRGHLLRAYIDRRADVTAIAPTEPTFYPSVQRQRPDVLDLALHKDLPFQVDIEALHDLSSDHLPVLLLVDTTPTRALPPRTAEMRTDWEKFKQLVEDRLEAPREPTNADELDDFTESFHSSLVSAVSDSSVPVPPRQRHSGLPRRIREHIRRRNRLRVQWRNTRHPEARRLLNRQNRVVKQLVDDFRTETWDDYLSTLNVEGGSVWRAAKQLRGVKAAVHPLLGRLGLVHTADAKAEAFADSMEAQFQTNNVNDPQTDARVEHFMEDFFHEPPEDSIEPFTEAEVKKAIRSLKPRKAPGLDRIGGKALQSAQNIFATHLLILFNSVLRLCHFPACWKSAKVIMIPKPSKDHLIPENHRPISLLPIVSKMFERLLLTRLSDALYGSIRPEQFGFRRGHSTTQQLIRVMNTLVDNINLNLCTTAVLLDVSKAFDKVWHEGLLFKLSDTGLPDSSIHLLRSYLENRSFQTSVEGRLSTDRPVRAGVPQGSVLGPVLYLVYTNDLPTVPGVTLSLYADDALLTCRSARFDQASRVMQRQMDVLSPWLEKWRIKVNADKSTAISFGKRRNRRRGQPAAVVLDATPIPWRPTVKYLGVTLDSRLCFRHHVDRKVAEATGILGLLWPLLNVRSPLPLKTKITVFLLIARSCMMYASEAWWALTSKSNRRRLEAVQSKTLRRITRQPWFVRNTTIRASAGVPTLEDFTKAKTAKLFQKAAESTFDHIRELCSRHDIAEDRRPRPVAILDDPP